MDALAAELRRHLDAPHLAVDDALRTPERDLRARVFAFLAAHYRGEVVVSTQRLPHIRTVGDAIRYFDAEYDERSVARGDDPARWRAARMYRVFGVRSDEELPPNLKYDERLVPSAPPSGDALVPRKRRMIRERLRKVMGAAEAPGTAAAAAVGEERAR